MTSDSSAFGSLFRVGIRKKIKKNDSDGMEAVQILENKLKDINGSIIDIVEKKSTFSR